MSVEILQSKLSEIQRLDKLYSTAMANAIYNTIMRFVPQEIWTQIAEYLNKFSVIRQFMLVSKMHALAVTGVTNMSLESEILNSPGSHSYIKQIALTKIFPHIRSLHVKHPMIIHANWHKLTKLHFDHDSCFVETGCNYIGSLTNLTSLSVPGNNLSRCLMLVNHSSIKKLNIRDNFNISQNILNQFTNLTSLNIGANARHINMSKLTNLTTLKIFKSISTINPVYTGYTIIKDGEGKCYRGAPQHYSK